MMSRKSSSQATSRSDQVSNRRRTLPRTKKVGLRKTVEPRSGRQFAHYAPPMVMRTGKAEVPIRQAKRSRARRRFDITLGRSGAEIRLPAFPMFHLNWTWFSGALLALVVWIVWTFMNSPKYQVETVALEGAQFITANEVTQVLGIEGKPVFVLSPEKIQAELQEIFPEFQEIHVNVSFPNQVAVSVTERVPVLVWVSPEGERWVDRDGYAFPVRAIKEDLPVFSASQFPKIEKKGETQPAEEKDKEKEATPEPTVDKNQVLLPETVAGMLALHQNAPENAPLLYDEKHGWGWEDPQGWQVFFGMEAGNMPKKLLVYREVVAELQAMGIRPKFISVEFPDAPYFRK